MALLLRTPSPKGPSAQDPSSEDADADADANTQRRRLSAVSATLE